MKHIHGGNVYTNSGLIDFSANINFLGMPNRIKQAAIKGIEESIHYPEPESKILSKKVAGYYKVDDYNVMVGNGAAEVIFMLVNALKPKKALLMAPTFYEYEQALNTVDCKIDKYYISLMCSKANNSNEADFRDLDGKLKKSEDENEVVKSDFIDCVSDETDIVFVCNPNNPTGSIKSKEFMLRLLSKCESVNAVLVVDESFLDFCENYEELTMVDALSNHNNLVIIKSFTKIFAMPGIRLGIALCGDSGLVCNMQKHLQPWNVSLPAQYAGMAAIEEMTDMSFINATRIAVKNEREYLLRELTVMGITAYESAANFMLLKGDTSLGDYCKTNGVLIRDCSNFEGLGTGWYRIAVRCHMDNEILIRILHEYM